MPSNNRNRGDYPDAENRRQQGDRNYRQDDYNENRGHGNSGYGQENDFNRPRNFGNSGSYSTDYGYQGSDSYRQSRNMGQQRYQGDQFDDRDQRYAGGYGNPGGYGNSGHYRDDYGSDAGRGDYNDNYGSRQRNESYENRSNDGSNYGRSSNGMNERSWWDRTRDEVSSWFGDDDAQRRRRMDELNGPHKGKGPKGYKRSVERIKEDVCDRLCDNSTIDASDIDIRVDGTDVILTGTVSSREDKRRAEDIAESVSGVSNVQNQLRVSRQESETSNPTATRSSMATSSDERRVKQN